MRLVEGGGLSSIVAIVRIQLPSTEQMAYNSALISAERQVVDELNCEVVGKVE